MTDRSNGSAAVVQATKRAPDAAMGAGTAWTPEARPAAPVQMPAQPRAAIWSLGAGAALAGLGAAIGLASGLQRLHASWMDTYSYSHGYLVLAMSLWLLMPVLRHAAPDVRPSTLGLLALAVAVVGYMLAEVVDIAIGIQAMLPVLALGLIWALGGTALARSALLPVAFLYFAIPLWNLLTVPLQNITTVVVTSLLPLLGITAYIEGYVVSTPAGMFEIAQGCSGLHFFVVGLALAAFYGLNWYARWSTRLLLLVAAGAMSMFANWVRVYTLIAVGDATQMQHYLIAEDHYVFGWVLYGVLMTPVLWLARRLELREAAGRSPGAERIEEPVAAPRTDARAPAFGSSFAFLATGAAAGLLLASPMLLRAGPDAPTVPAVIALPAMPVIWTATAPSQDWRPSFHQPHAALHAGYAGAAGPKVDLYIARYLGQAPDSKLIYHRNTLDHGWQQLTATARPVPVNGTMRTVREVELAARGERRLVWYWYRVGGTPTHDRTQAKLLELPALARGRRDGAVIAVSASCTIRCDVAREQMADLLSIAGASLEAAADGIWEGAP
jgi:EpsI family protein